MHHTPDAAAAVRSLARLLAPGGVLAFYVYKHKAPLREYADDYLREHTTKMSVVECMDFSAAMSELGRKLSDLGATITLERDIPLLGIPAGEHDVQRLVYWYFLKCFWNDDFSPNLNDLVNFDWYHPPYASRHTEDEVRGWCDELGLAIEHLDVSDAGISVRTAPLGLPAASVTTSSQETNAPAGRRWAELEAPRPGDRRRRSAGSRRQRVYTAGLVLVSCRDQYGMSGSGCR